MIINKKKNYKKLIISLLSIILLFLITIAVIKYYQEVKHQKVLQEEKQRVRQYTDITDFKDIQEVALYLNCKLIKQEDVNDDSVSYRIYMELPMKISENGSDASNLVENLIQYSAYVLNYKNFVIVDETNSDSITVYCKEDKQLVETYFINETENYYEVINTKENIENFTKVPSIEFSVDAEELKQLLEKGWQAGAVKFGTMESTYRNYNIYFDEGIEVRIIDGKVFNLIYTPKYEKTIINNLKVSSNMEEIKKTLGEPQFLYSDLIGYKGKNMYVFFCKDQVSIYRYDDYDTNGIAKIIKDKPDNIENEKTFVDEIKKEWKDYDIYDYSTDYVKLQYTLKGMCIKYDSTTKKGVILYNNYQGKVFGDVTLEDIIEGKESLPSGIIIENSDLVFEEEKNRINTLDDTTSAYNFVKPGIVLNKSNEFKVYQKSTNSSNAMHKIRFISINNQFPNSELREIITMGIWLDDYNFIYSVKDRGIFKYNVKERIYDSIIIGEGDYILKEVKDKILYYNDTSIDLNI